MRIITIVNKSTVVSDRDFAEAVAAVRVQVTRDFAPRWGGLSAILAVGPDTAGERIYIADNSDQAGALGYHYDPAGVPIGYVFAQTDLNAGESWTATLSHEVLEQIADPTCDICRYCKLNGLGAAVALEVCDPGENDEYGINGVQVSNFITPAWFGLAPPGSPLDFMGKIKKPLTCSKGGYFQYTTDLRRWKSVFGDQAKLRQLFPDKHCRRSRRQQRSILTS